MLSRGHKEEITKSLSPEAAETFSLWINGCRALRNASVARQNAEYGAWKAAGGDTDNRPAPDQSYSWIYGTKDPQGRSHDWLRKLPSVLLRNARSEYYKDFTAFTRGLRRVPTFRSCKDKASVWLTRELLTFERREASDGESNLLIHVFVGKGKARRILFTKTLPWPDSHALPSSIRITRLGARFWLSFSYEYEPAAAVVPQEKLAERYQQVPAADLEPVTVGLDRGVRKPVATSHGEFYGSPADEAQRLRKKEARKRRWQRKLARRKSGSQNRRKAKEKLGSQQAGLRGVRHNRAHHISKEMASAADTEILVFEDLKTKNMTRSAKGTKAKPGKNVKAKAGLNRSILGSMWGNIKTFTEYKARERSKLVVVVPPHHTSRSCPVCGDCHEDNRKGERFHCRNCGHKDDADTNASVNIRDRGIAKIHDGTLIEEIGASSKKTIAARKKAATTARTAGSYACGDQVSPSAKQKAPVEEAGKEAQLCA